MCAVTARRLLRRGKIIKVSLYSEQSLERYNLDNDRDIEIHLVARMFRRRSRSFFSWGRYGTVTIKQAAYDRAPIVTLV